MATPELVAEVVAAYNAGDKIETIERTFGLPRATIYYLLAQADVTPKRQKQRHRMAMNGQQVARLLAAIQEQEATISALEAENHQLRIANAELQLQVQRG
jgi:transposase